MDGITVETTGTGRKKTATIKVTYNFSEPVEVVENATSDGAPLLAKALRRGKEL